MLYADKGQLSVLSGVPRSTAPEIVDKQLRYNVFVLGARGSGKTVFLACLHRHLANEHPENRFHLKCEPEEAEAQLDAFYQEVAGLESAWPPGSSVIADYEFQCRHNTPKGAVNLFRIGYTDYPGGAFDGTQAFGAEEKQKIRERTARAHALIVLIDGQKVLHTLEGRQGAAAALHWDLFKLTRRLMDGAAKPILFLLTKYDILERTYPLLRIREELFKCKDFADFVDMQRSFGLPLHLIPVSAVGFNFAKYDAATGRMDKIPDGAPFPVNLEFALGCTVINQFKLYEDDRRDGGLVAKAKAAGLWLWTFASNAVDEFRIPGSPLSISIRKLLGVLRIGDLSLDEKLIDLLKRPIVDQKSAIETVFELMAVRMAELKVKEPATDLIERLEK